MLADSTQVCNRALSTSSADGLNGNQLSCTDDEGIVEVVDRRTDVAWDQVQHIPDSEDSSAARDAYGQVFFAGGKRFEVRVSQNDTGGNTGVGRDGLVPGIASDDSVCGMAYHTRSYNGRGTIS